MNPFFVEWSEEALDGLADAWLNATDRNAVNQAAEGIERRLRRDPLGEGRAVHEGLYRIDEPPLAGFYSVDEDAREVRVTDILLLS